MRRFAFVLWLPVSALRAATAEAAPVVILKLDDLRDDVSSRVGFQYVADSVVRRRIKASFGVIADSYDDTAAPGTKRALYEWTKALVATGRIEIWNHGLDHSRTPGGTEFSNRTLAFQTQHLLKAQALLNEHCGVVMRSFGAPYNRTDAITAEALRSVPELKVWMFPDVAEAEPLLLTRHVAMERRAGVMDAAQFKKNYEANATADYMVLQGHPPYWTVEDRAQFEDVLDFLAGKSVTFMTPDEYALSPARRHIQ